MRIPITKYGRPQVVVFPAIILVIMAVLAVWLKGGAVLACAEVILVLVLGWVLAFFRDPHRNIPSDEDVLLSPADGKITDIETVDEPNFIEGKAVRIGIFLNIFNVHINRMPCAARVENITYKPGKYKNAMSPESARVNEANEIAIVKLDSPCDKLLVRQISGAIARRIVCAAAEGQEFAGGAKFGMIKFGSRTELYLPAREGVKCIAQIGDKVKAGTTILVRYDQ